MKDIDKKITEALRQSYPEVDLADEPSLAEELISAFRGRNQFTSAMAFCLILVSLGFAVWSAIQFFEAQVVREQLMWGGVCFFCLIFISFMKVWFWLEMHSNRVLREIKRLELILSSKQD